MKLSKVGLKLLHLTWTILWEPCRVCIYFFHSLKENEILSFYMKTPIFNPFQYVTSWCSHRLWSRQKPEPLITQSRWRQPTLRSLTPFESTLKILQTSQVRLTFAFCFEQLLMCWLFFIRLVQFTSWSLPPGRLCCQIGRQAQTSSYLTSTLAPSAAQQRHRDLGMSPSSPFIMWNFCIPSELKSIVFCVTSVIQPCFLSPTTWCSITYTPSPSR